MMSDRMLAGMRRSREEWQSLVGELRDSGVRVADFARRKGLRVNTLQWWRWKLRGDVVKAGPVTLAKFVPLRPAGSAVSGSQVVEARVGSVVLRFECGTDVDYVATLIGQLERVC